MLLSEFLRARPEPAARQSAFAAACTPLPQPLDKAEDARPWLNADGELAEGILPRGHVLDMLGLQDEPRQAQAEPSAHPAALFLARTGVAGSSMHASSDLIDVMMLGMC